MIHRLQAETKYAYMIPEIVEKAPQEAVLLHKVLTRQQLESIIHRKPLLLENNSELQDDSKLVKIAIEADGRALKFASDRLKDYALFVKIAMRTYPGIKYHLPNRQMIRFTS